MLKEIKERAMITVEQIIGLAIALLVLFAVLPTVMGSFFNASTTGWDSTTKTIWSLLPIIVLVVVLLAIYGKRHK